MRNLLGQTVRLGGGGPGAAAAGSSGGHLRQQIVEAAAAEAAAFQLIISLLVRRGGDLIFGYAFGRLLWQEASAGWLGGSSLRGEAQG